VANNCADPIRFKGRISATNFQAREKSISPQDDSITSIHETSFPKKIRTGLYLSLDREGVLQGPRPPPENMFSTESPLVLVYYLVNAKSVTGPDSDAGLISQWDEAEEEVAYCGRSIVREEIILRSVTSSGNEEKARVKQRGEAKQAGFGHSQHCSWDW